MITKQSIENQLRRGGYQDADINLGSLLSKRAYESHMSLGANIYACSDCCHIGELEYRPVTGIGPMNSPLMIVVNKPGIEEAHTTVPFIGVEGQLLTMILAKAGIDRNSIYMTYASKVPLNHEPKPSELQHFREHFIAEIEAINPKVILTFGDGAMRMSRNDYATQIQGVRGNLQEFSYQTETGTKKIQLVNSYDLRHVLEPSENMSAYKHAIWNDIHKAFTEVKRLKPSYTYDRVGLERLI